MMERSKLINYASNFLETEIGVINEMLKKETLNDESKYILESLLKNYEKDLEELESEKNYK